MKKYRLISELILEDCAVKILWEALKNFLKNGKWEEANDVNVDLLVIIPRIGDKISLNDLKWLRDRTNSSHQANVLLIDPYDCFRFPELSVDILPWLHVLKQAGFGNTDKLSHKLKSWQSSDSKTLFENNVVNSLKELIINYTNKNINSYNQYIQKEFIQKNIGKKTTSQMLLKESPLAFYYGLVRLDGKYDVIEHELNKSVYALDSHAENNNEIYTKTGRVIQLQRFVNAHHDILLHLRNPLPEPVTFSFVCENNNCMYFNNTNEQQHQKKVILLVDDHPELFYNDLKKIIDQCCEKYELWVWKPQIGSHEDFLMINDLEQYNSLNFSCKNINKKLFHVYRNINRETEKICFECIIRKCAYILVDVLFEIPGGEVRNLGASVISGFVRLFHDITVQSSDIQSTLPDPEVIAISRADDIEKIQTCLHSGAKGYVLKSRLLMLPSVLSRSSLSASKSTDKYHRNFRRLYDLPCDIIGLLKQISILSNDISKPDLSDDTITPEQVATAELIRSIPKSDLHLHVGSLMHPDFLVIASLVMLARHKPVNKNQEYLISSIVPLFSFWNGEKAIKMNTSIEGESVEIFNFTFPKGEQSFVGEDSVKIFADTIKEEIKDFIQNNNKLHDFRSILHKDLGILDHWHKDSAIKAIDKISSVSMMLFAISRGSLENDVNIRISQDDILRLFLVFLSTKSNFTIKLLKGKTSFKELLHPFSINNNNVLKDVKKIFDDLHKEFYSRFNACTQSNAITDHIGPNPSKFEVNVSIKPDFLLHKQKQTPIEFMLASGTRGDTLAGYLEGCEYTGAEHLRHPYLIFLFAQKTIEYLVQHGVLYAELRAAASGYVNQEIGFNYQNVCCCLVTAFEQAQDYILTEYNNNHNQNDIKIPWLWVKDDKPSYSRLLIKQTPEEPFFTKRFPTKVNLILTGKRHKPSKQMITEAAAIVMLHSSPRSVTPSAANFASTEMNRCRMVGFDLAGLEESFPPEIFKEYFKQIIQFHIPITVHAGENASVQFIENAVLDLRARRIGHGLVIVDDESLMNRIRDHRVCIELCPVSNYQTNKFDNSDNCVEHSVQKAGRCYPLRKLIENGNAVCINTDNPFISCTNIIKECFQASYAYGGRGLSLWELLRIFRMGFVHSFMSLPERRAILELADQIIFDLFSQEETINLLCELKSKLYD